MDDFSAIADRLRKAGAVFSILDPPLTSLSFCQPLPPGVLDDIARMTCVQILYLGGSDVTDADVERLAGLAGLTWLELSDTPVTNRAVSFAAKYPHLQTLMLYGTSVDDECIPILESMPKLCNVGLDDSRVTASGLARLRNSRPDVEVA